MTIAIHFDAQLTGQLRQFFELLRAGELPFGPLEIIVPIEVAAPAAPERLHQAAPQLNRIASTDARGAHATEAPEPAAEPPDTWPHGPLINNRAIGAHHIKSIATAMLSDPTIIGTDPGVGLNRARMTALLERLGFDRPFIGRAAVPLLIWFGLASVLAPGPEDAPWSSPRALLPASEAELRAALWKAELPNPEHIAQARQRGLK